MSNYEGVKFGLLVDYAPKQVQGMLQKLAKVKESSAGHPEMNALEHTKIAVERAMQNGDPDLVMAALFHDLGKWHTQRYHPALEAYVFPNHERVSAGLVDSYGWYINKFGADPRNVGEIVKHHVRFRQFEKMKPETQSELSGNMELLEKMRTFQKINDMTKEYQPVD